MGGRAGRGVSIAGGGTGRDGGESVAGAHAALDSAVAAAYGWTADISEEEALGKLLALNLGEGSGS